MIKRQSQIELKVKEALDPEHLEVINESSQHNVPPGSESHFRIIIVSEKFADQTLLDRHRKMNEILAGELKDYIHALALETFTPKEWEDRNKKVALSPPCLGGSKSDQS